jgi:carbon-monoxide dehydrogenase medium subunit
MPTFDYHAPTSKAEALELLGKYGDEAHLIAGGTSVVLMMQQRLLQPAHVVGLRGVSELRGIKRTADGGLEIGALTSHRELETSADVKAYCPALAETFGHVATIRIRNQGTVGGNLVHADPAQDPPPTLMALNGSVVIEGASGSREVSLDDFFLDYFETAVQEGEILTTIKLPPQHTKLKTAYLKFLPRTVDDYATVAVAVSLLADDAGVCKSVRIGLGSAGVTPLRARKVEAALLGQKLTAAVIKDASELVVDEVDPLDDTRGSADYKRKMARVWTDRALRQVALGEVRGTPTRQIGASGSARVVLA